MVINGKVHCFFEQSGTFKNEFIKLGIPAEDYDIQNNFGETDHFNDLFAEFDHAFDGLPSVFDNIDPDNDFIMAFFPCIEFSCLSQMWFSLTHRCFETWPDKKKVEYIVEKNQKRSRMYELLNKFCGIVLDKKIRMVLENPWSEQTYLKQNVFLKQPTFIDTDRTRRGDYFKKPTAYWFWNCEPTVGYSYQQTAKSDVKHIWSARKSPVAGLCSEERSMISPDYARNFICDFILGKKQEHTEPQLFDNI